MVFDVGVVESVFIFRGVVFKTGGFAFLGRRLFLGNRVYMYVYVRIF